MPTYSYRGWVFFRDVVREEFQEDSADLTTHDVTFQSNSTSVDSVTMKKYVLFRLCELCLNNFRFWLFSSFQMDRVLTYKPISKYPHYHWHDSYKFIFQKFSDTHRLITENRKESWWDFDDLDSDFKRNWWALLQVLALHLAPPRCFGYHMLGGDTCYSDWCFKGRIRFRLIAF